MRVKYVAYRPYSTRYFWGIPPQVKVLITDAQDEGIGRTNSLFHHSVGKEGIQLLLSFKNNIHLLALNAQVIT